MNAEIIIIMLNRLDQLGDTGGSGICQNGKLKIFDCVKIRGRRFNIGLTDIKGINLLSLLLRCNRIGVEFTHRREIARQCLLRNLHSNPPIIFSFSSYSCAYYPMKHFHIKPNYSNIKLYVIQSYSRKNIDILSRWEACGVHMFGGVQGF